MKNSRKITISSFYSKHALTQDGAKYRKRPRLQVSTYQTANMSALPTEILEIIFQYFYDGLTRPLHSFDDKLKGAEPRSLIPLLHTCRTWQALVEPFLYRRVWISFGPSKHGHSPVQLISTLRTRPYLCSYIQDIWLDLMSEKQPVSGPPSAYHESSIRNIIWLLNKVSKSVKVIGIRGRGKLDYDVRLCHAITSLPLQTLRLGLGWAKLVLHYLRNSRAVLPIMYLDVIDGESYDNEHNLLGNVGTDTIESARLSDGRGIAQLKVLTIRGQSLGPRNMELLCKWPEALDCLQIYPSHLHSRIEYVTTELLQRLISQQKKNLKVIRVLRYDSFSTRDRNQIPDFRDCLRLEVLEVGFWNLRNDLPRQACHKIAAPCLRRLDIVTVYRNRGRTGDANGYTVRPSDFRYKMAEFDQEGMQWLVDFVVFYQRHYPNGPLRKIYIELNWNYWKVEIGELSSSADKSESCVSLWPNTYLVAAKSQVEACGIELTWATPSMEKVR